MIVTINNRKYNDEIKFEIDHLNDNTRQDILDSVHSIGWEDKDCWSEVEE